MTQSSLACRSIDEGTDGRGESALASWGFDSRDSTRRLDTGSSSYLPHRPPLSAAGAARAMRFIATPSTAPSPFRSHCWRDLLRGRGARVEQPRPFSSSSPRAWGGRSISFLTSAQRLQVARAHTLLPREKRAFFLQRAVFHLRPAFAVAPSDADVEAAIAAAHLALTQHGETASR